MKKSWFYRRNQKIFPGHYTRQKRSVLKFDLLTAGLAVIIALCALAAWGRPHEIAQADATGFVLWFLMFLAYLPLELLHLLDWCTGGALDGVLNFLFAEDKAWGLGIFNLIILFILWGFVRVLTFRKYDERLLRICGHLILIFFVWGCFQFGCMLAMKMWEQDRISACHTCLKEKK